MTHMVSCFYFILSGPLWTVLQQHMDLYMCLYDLSFNTSVGFSPFLLCLFAQTLMPWRLYSKPSVCSVCLGVRDRC